MAADPELVRTLDYILNHSNEASIEVLAEAVVRRRRDLTYLGATGASPDPTQMAKDITSQITDGVGGGLETMRTQIREMMLRIIKEHAPELTDKQMDELCEAWMPDGKRAKENKSKLPRDVLESMIEQFLAFSNGTMRKSVDEKLREDMADWPERYWNAFPPVVRGLITDYLKNKITGEEFNSRMNIALDM
jgi:hypothetical protein